MDEFGADAQIQRSPLRYFCLAFHAENGAEALRWLQKNVSWKSRELTWRKCHPLHCSSPETEQGMPIDNRPAFLLVISTRVAAEESDVVEERLSKVSFALLCACAELRHGLVEEPVVLPRQGSKPRTDAGGHNSEKIM
jgi:hypothetical protein